MIPVRAGLAATLLLAAAWSVGHTSDSGCTIVPGRTLALVHVEKDTTLPYAPGGMQATSRYSAGPTPDSILATPGTPMPAGRVRLLALDSATRRTLSDNGIADARPVAFIRAAPYQHDCATIRWRDTVPFVVPGEVGYVRGVLGDPGTWVDGVPVIIVRDAWNYPYPRRRSLAYSAPREAPLASAKALFELQAALQTPEIRTREERVAADSVRHVRGIAWARANPDQAELEPARRTIRELLLQGDWPAVSRTPSRLRGTYRVRLESGSDAATWYFRTHELPRHTWHGGDSLQTVAAFLRSPFVPGYHLGAYPATSLESLPVTPPDFRSRPPVVWLSSNDRPTDPANGARRTLTGLLDFPLSAVPEALWPVLDPLAEPRMKRDSASLARLKITVPNPPKQVPLPLTLHLGAEGSVSADTSVVVAGRTLRVRLERVDTAAYPRGY